MKKNVKFVTCIYNRLFGTKFGGRHSRNVHYKWSLVSLLKMTDADFVCYTSEEEFQELSDFFYIDNQISKEQLEIKIFDLSNHYFLNLFDKFKDYDSAKSSDRCVEIQYMKFIWLEMEDMSYDYYFWIDAGLSHCGLIPNKYLSLTGPHNQGYYESSLFNNQLLNNLLKNSENKLTILGKENERNYWSGTVNPKHFFNYDRSYHIIGGLFGGKNELVQKMIEFFKKYVYQVTIEDNRLYHEEDVMTLMFRNHEELFHVYKFDTWYHRDAPILGLSEDHFDVNKSFYRIFEELQ